MKTLLWEGKAETINTKYTFKDGVGDIEDYDFICIEYWKGEDSKLSTMINSNDITKDAASDILLQSIFSRRTWMHFVDNGFYVDEITVDNEVDLAKLYVRKIYGIKY